MNHDWNAEQLLTEHFDAPIRFHLHEGSIDLTDIKTHIHNRIHGVDSKGKRHLLHNENILFAISVEKIKNVREHIKMFRAVKNLKLTRKSIAQNRFCVDDVRLEAVVGDNIAIVTRRGHVIRGELQTFDKYHLFMQVGKQMVLVYRSGLFGFKEEIDAALRQNQNLDALRETRNKGLQALIDNKWIHGFKRLLTELYPDNAHFIYELLQNAEDAGASKVRFVLKNDSCEFEHNGAKLFTIDDVESITNIGSGTKAEDPTNIGKFGIGFKAVFAYTSTPEIESGGFHFLIRDMLVPDTKDLFPCVLGEGKTRFVFPFDNPKKPPEQACTEIEKNLRKLNENTLLFLNNIRKIEYCLPDSTKGSLERREIANDRNRIEIYVTRPADQTPESQQYLRFAKDVTVQDETGESKCCQIAIAFGMDKSPRGGWKIIPLNPGQVCIYFPAVKETSKLRFHLHAPFASTVARDSVRECPANDELRNHLSDLIAESMHIIRDIGLLDVEFLATLPNDQRELSPFYQPFQERLIEEFNKEKLTPMKRRWSEHAAASGVYRGSVVLSDLIDDEDLAVLLGRDPSQPLWIANPPQINQSADNFLSMLDISRWTTEDLIEVLDGHSNKVTKWLRDKSDEWHQDLYVLLGDFLSRASSYSSAEKKLPNLRIVRCHDDEYRAGSECHFYSDDVGPAQDLLASDTGYVEGIQLTHNEEDEYEENFHYVVKAVYSSGRSNDNEKAHKFLEDIGVRKVDETERIKLILRERYKDQIRPRDEDMEKFMALVEDEPEKKSLFKDYFIFEVDLERDNKRWFSKPSQVFVDSPYLETGLTVYYSALEEDSGSFKRALSPNYVESGINLKRLGEFAKALGARTQLEADEQKIPENHPEWHNHLSQGSGVWRQNTGIDEDYRIPECQILLANPSITKSKLLWQAMCSLPEEYLKAQFCWNQSNPLNEGHSSLVHELRNAKWVPQKNGDSISFVYPREASIEHLPEGFSYETRQNWLDAIKFGEIAKKQRSENILKEAEQNLRNRRATEMGFNSADEANTMAEIANAWKAQGKSPDELRNKLMAGKRRKERILIELEDAPEKEYEQRLRSVRSTIGTIDRRTYLRARYTTDDDKMECQMCRQDMPFKKRNSDEDYFEAVEALKKDHFSKEHEAQHLALCPECAAKYKEFVKRDEAARKALYDFLKNSQAPEVRLQLEDFVIRIWFEDKHWQDLKTVLYYYENVYDPDDVD